MLLHLQFPATACEDSSSASLIIRNSSTSSSQMFEFGVPQGSCLKVRGWTQWRWYQPNLHGAIAVAWFVLMSCQCTRSVTAALLPLLHRSNAVLLCATPCCVLPGTRSRRAWACWPFSPA